MRKFIGAYFKHLVFGLVLSVGILSDSEGQSFVQLFDYSGKSVVEYQNELIEAADSLIAAFPVEYQDEFKVYDFGFYLHQEDYDGFHYPDEFSRVIREEIDSKYYLVFGRQLDQNGANVKTWVKFKFEHEDFDCINSETISIQLGELINSEILLGNSNVYSRMASLMETFSPSLEPSFCCYSGEGRMSNTCTPLDDAMIISAADCLMNNGYGEMMEWFKVVLDFFSKCNDTGWNTFRPEIGIIPHCVWDGKDLSGVDNFSGLDIAFMSGYYDGIFEEVKALLHLPNTAKDIYVGMMRYNFHIYQSILKCGLSPNISDPNNLGCEFDEKSLELFHRTMYHIKENQEVYFANNQEGYNSFLNTYEMLKPYEYFIHIPLVGDIEADCGNAYELQDMLYSVYTIIKNVDNIIVELDSIVVQAKEIWKDVNLEDNEVRYFIGYYGIRVAIIVTPLTIDKITKITKNAKSFFNSLKLAVIQNQASYVTWLNKALGVEVFHYVVLNKSWYLSIATNNRPLFNVLFHNDGRFLLWFNSKGVRVEAWGRAIDGGLHHMPNNKIFLETMGSYLLASNPTPKLHANLSLIEEASIRFYTTNPGYKDLNRALRGEISMTPYFQEQANVLSNAVSKLPVSSHNAPGNNLWRIENLTDSQFASEYVKGVDVTKASFYSSTYSESAVIEASRERVHNVLVRIEGKNGKLIEDVSTLPAEKEILFNKNTKFEVVDVGFSPHPDFDRFPGTPIKTVWLKEK